MTEAKQIPMFTTDTTDAPVKLKRKSEAMGETVASARARLANNIDDGMKCPCCDRVARRQVRTLTGDLARLLLRFRDRAMTDGAIDGVVDVRKVRSMRGTSYPKLAYFGLIKPYGGERGMWIITSTGLGFLDGRSRVASWVLVYGGKVVDVATTTVDFAEALSVKRGAR